MHNRSNHLIPWQMLIFASFALIINQALFAESIESQRPAETELVELYFTHGLPSQLAYPRVVRLVMGMQSQFRVIALYQFSEQDQQMFHSQRIDVYDGQGALAHSRDYEFKPDQTMYYAYADLSLNPATHQPGDWQIEIYLDDQLMGSEYLQVLADKAALAATSPDQPLIVGHPIIRKEYFDDHESYTASVTMHVDRDGKVTEVTSDGVGSYDPTIFDILARDAAGQFVFPPDSSRPDQGKEYQQTFDFVQRESLFE